MKDRLPVKIIKRLALGCYYLDKALLRLVRTRTLGERRYVLTGTCDPCGKCCETPAIQIPVILFYLPVIKRVFIKWQKYVNGFIYLRQDRLTRCLFFTCSHYDAKTKLCDSYDTRPGMCRDYPGILLKSPCPRLFSECSYCIIDCKAASLKSYLEKCNIPEEKRKRLYKNLYIDQL